MFWGFFCRWIFGFSVRSYLPRQWNHAPKPSLTSSK
jgi:hypothetical protein